MNFAELFKGIDTRQVRNIIAIASYNELEALPTLIAKLCPKLGANDLVIVLDDSQHETSILLERLVRASYKNSSCQLVFINFAEKSGRGAAIRKGMELCLLHITDFKFYLECDADESHQVDDILGVINSKQNCDLLIGSRYITGSRIINWPIQRRIFSKLLNILIPFLLGLKVKDVTNGLRRYSNTSVKVLLNYEQLNFGFTYLSEQAYILKTNKLSICEFPITFINRRLGKSTVNFKEILSSIKGILVLFINMHKFRYEK
jgi:dolichol-phosphate mannosyltransferase